MCLFVVKNVLTSFAMFLKHKGYTTRLWENSFTSADVDAVCNALSEWAQTEWNLPGEFLMLWSRREHGMFVGDSELIYFESAESNAYLVPNPFLEGDAEGFVVAVQAIVNGRQSELYRVMIQAREMYNAV